VHYRSVESLREAKKLMTDAGVSHGSAHTTLMVRPLTSFVLGYPAQNSFNCAEDDQILLQINPAPNFQGG